MKGHVEGSRLVLASDLDGTLAHGSARAREAVVRRVAADPGSVLIYVTGRTPSSARELARRMSLPEPDLLIADVGTTVLRGFGPEREAAVEAELERAWPGGDVVRDRLTDEDALVPQQIDAPRRASYWIEPVRRLERESAASPGAAGSDAFAARDPDQASLGAEAAELAASIARRAASRLEDLDVDVVVSANVFLDVLPGGVNKGTTLRRVLRRIGAADEDCVVAGDSLNDLALFETGLRAIVVGNCEPALRSRVAGRAHVYQATEHGADGVLEGLEHYQESGYDRSGVGAGTSEPKGRDGE